MTKQKHKPAEVKRTIITSLQPDLKAFAGPTPILAIDCEMIQCVDKSKQLARVSIVNYNRQVIFDEYIKPEGEVKDYLSEITNLNSFKIKNAKNLAFHLPRIKEILGRDKIVVGHTIESDLEPLGITHDPKLLRDVALFSGYRDGKFRVSLKNLTAQFLGFNIQAGAHSSVEDARAALELYKLNKLEIDCEFKDTYFKALKEKNAPVPAKSADNEATEELAENAQA